jgi:hypothetical protein
MNDTSTGHGAHGLMAEFETPDNQLAAAHKTYGAGYRQMDAYSPLPVHGLAAAIGFAQTNLAVISFVCGVIGCVAGFGLQYFVHMIDYPINIGGRPHLSSLMFIPVTFETTILFAALGTVVGMILLNRLPQPYHPVFNVPEFERASQDRFFLCIESSDPQYSKQGTTSFLQSLDPVNVSEVEA